MSRITILTVLVSMLLLSMLGIQLVTPVRTTMTRTAAIDLYTQKEDPHSGKGPNQPSGRFKPQEVVILYAYVTNNSNAVPNKIVAFEIHGPPNSIYNITIIRTASTNTSGVATINFRIPWISENPEIIVGMWSAYASVQIAEEKVEDTLTFMVGLIVDDDGPADFHIIQEAINNATDGDTIFVRAGTYYEHVVVNKSMSLVGENRKTTIIGGNGVGNVTEVVVNDVTVMGFTVRNNGMGLKGIALSHVKNCKISGNNIENNTIGIGLADYSSHNSISENKIATNNYGIWLGYSSNNSICHNNFVDNTDQVYSTNSTNVWDDSYPSGGNYWSGYNGADLYSGLYQNDTGSDGIGDAPYVIDENNRDKYPLMNPYVAPIVEWEFNATKNGETRKIRVISNSIIIDFNFNYTLQKMDFNVTGPYGTSGFCNVILPKDLINDTVVVLVNGDPLDYKMQENATHFFIYFTYSHSISRVEILATILGDINGDRIIDVMDILVVGLAFGSKPGDPNWNPIADLSEDWNGKTW